MVPETQFTKDVLGRYICNTFQEAMDSANPAVFDDAKPFDIIVIGGGSFSGIIAQHLFKADVTHSHRILVLEGGPFVLPEHTQNLPKTGITAPGPVMQDVGIREEVWGLAWRSNVQGGFPGLAYCVGGRSVFWGGWSPQLILSELPVVADINHPNAWPPEVVNELNNNVTINGVIKPGYFRQAAEQIGVTQTNDFIEKDLHKALRKQLFDNYGSVTDAIPLALLELHLDDVPPPKKNLFKLEAPLAVSSKPPRSGFFPFNKFSSVPLISQSSRQAWEEIVSGLPYGTQGRDSLKRMMVVPNCHVLRLITDIDGLNGTGKVTGVLTNFGFIPLPTNGRVIMGLGTIENTRVALLSFGGIKNYNLVGTNLMAHLRSNYTFSIHRSGLTSLRSSISDLEQSALFLKGRTTLNNGAEGHFHLQITAAGGGDGLNTDSDAELFKKIPDTDSIESFKQADPDTVIITVRSIGETQPQNPESHVTLDLAGPTDEHNIPRAFVNIAQPQLLPQPGDSEQTKNDRLLWDALDKAADDVATIFSNGTGINNPSKRRDGMGTTHHEAGTLWMGNDPLKSVTNNEGRFHFVDNAYVVGPALFPTIGSPNPMLTGTALARRTADKILSQTAPTADVVELGFVSLFDGTEKTYRLWKNAGFNWGGPGTFYLIDGKIVAYPGSEYSILYYWKKNFGNFTLKLDFKLGTPNDNSGIFVRCGNPAITWPAFDTPNYTQNRAKIMVQTGFEIQVDDLAIPDGLDMHRTGAIYNIPIGNNAGEQNYQQPPLLGTAWHTYEISVQGDQYTVLLDGVPTSSFLNNDISRGKSPVADPNFGYIGIQAHSGRVMFKNIRIKE